MAVGKIWFVLSSFIVIQSLSKPAGEDIVIENGRTSVLCGSEGVGLLSINHQSGTIICPNGKLSLVSQNFIPENGKSVIGVSCSRGSIKFDPPVSSGKSTRMKVECPNGQLQAVLSAASHITRNPTDCPRGKVFDAKTRKCIIAWG